MFCASGFFPYACINARWLLQPLTIHDTGAMQDASSERRCAGTTTSESRVARLTCLGVLAPSRLRMGKGMVGLQAWSHMKGARMGTGKSKSQLSMTRTLSMSYPHAIDLLFGLKRAAAISQVPAPLVLSTCGFRRGGGFFSYFPRATF